jgi:hypothetical protein
LRAKNARINEKEYWKSENFGNLKYTKELNGYTAKIGVQKEGDFE